MTIGTGSSLRPLPPPVLSVFVFFLSSSSLARHSPALAGRRRLRPQCLPGGFWFRSRSGRGRRAEDTEDTEDGDEDPART